MILPEKPLKNERFDAKLTSKIQNTDQLVTYIDSVAAVKGIRQNTNLYAYLILETVEDRFFHSYSHYSLNENWIAALGGRYVWYDVSAIVDANDILKYPMAACSQQSIVLMNVFKAKNIPYRKVGFDGHYAVEAEINKQWIFFDANLEPQTNQNMQRFDYLVQGDHMAVYYKNVLTPAQISSLFKHIVTGEVNADPAPRISWFHIITRFLSHWLWVLPMCLFLISMVKSHKKRFLKVLEGNSFSSPAEINLEYNFHHIAETPRQSIKKE
ncbi:hypothetical protein [Mucilaginibacter jinjuensis]|uniref:Transglutaminase superfamily protein n=1 Tax=Mucilaginibacter jinjuensis TaxID=1176721 RepID=A0ABY7TEC3_9SPHI|nr:hypothetical protein [Mucilaginibacter jinjuensis]WCT14063.1 hypothetical protein PQO05_08960 [Mucilaginibacter jinjuensis]